MQAVFFPIFIGLKSINKFKHIINFTLIPWGFIFLGLASMFEMIDHTKTEWIYIDHSSFFNWCFYTFLSLGLTFLSISVLRNKIFIILNLFICSLAIISYWLLGKQLTLIFQVLISIFLIINWQKRFKDWFFILYPLFGILFTTFLGIKLSLTSNQIWHVFIGPSGTISVLTFFQVLLRSNAKLSFNKKKKLNSF